MVGEGPLGCLTSLVLSDEEGILLLAKQRMRQPISQLEVIR